MIQRDWGRSAGCVPDSFCRDWAPQLPMWRGESRVACLGSGGLRLQTRTGSEHWSTKHARTSAYKALLPTHLRPAMYMSESCLLYRTMCRCTVSYLCVCIVGLDPSSDRSKFRGSIQYTAVQSCSNTGIFLSYESPSWLAVKEGLVATRSTELITPSRPNTRKHYTQQSTIARGAISRRLVGGATLVC